MKNRRGCRDETVEIAGAVVAFAVERIGWLGAVCQERPTFLSIAIAVEQDRLSRGLLELRDSDDYRDERTGSPAYRTLMVALFE